MNAVVSLGLVCMSVAVLGQAASASGPDDVVSQRLIDELRMQERDRSGPCAAPDGFRCIPVFAEAGNAEVEVPARMTVVSDWTVDSCPACRHLSVTLTLFLPDRDETIVAEVPDMPVGACGGTSETFLNWFAPCDQGFVGSIGRDGAQLIVGEFDPYDRLDAFQDAILSEIALSYPELQALVQNDLLAVSVDVTSPTAWENRQHRNSPALADVAVYRVGVRLAYSSRFNRPPVTPPVVGSARCGVQVDLPSFQIADPDGDLIRFTWVDDEHSSIASVGNGNYRIRFYRPPPSCDALEHQFRYYAEDDCGEFCEELENSGHVLVTILPDAVQDPPFSPSRFDGNVLRLDVLDNDTPNDFQRTLLSLATFTQPPAGGSVRRSDDDDDILEFVRAGSWTGTTTFSYTVTDGRGNFDSAQVSVSYADRDADGVLDVLDNCPDHSNGGQQNWDGDSKGDACDVLVTAVYRVDPRRTYLHRNQDPAPDPVLGNNIIDLYSVGAGGIRPDQRAWKIGLYPAGNFAFFPDQNPETGTAMIGLFSTSATIRGNNEVPLDRVPGALDVGVNIDTAPTYHGNEPTNIQEDFQVVGQTITLDHPGIRFLFLSANDTHFNGNEDAGPEEEFFRIGIQASPVD